MNERAIERTMRPNRKLSNVCARQSEQASERANAYSMCHMQSKTLTKNKTHIYLPILWHSDVVFSLKSHKIHSDTLLAVYGRHNLFAFTHQQHKIYTYMYRILCSVRFHLTAIFQMCHCWLVRTQSHTHTHTHTEEYTPPLQLNRKKVNDHHTHISQIHFLAFAYSFAPFSLQPNSRRGNAEYT